MRAVQCLAIAALLWPAPMIRVAQHRTRLDDIIPEYQSSERHSERIHAKPDQAMQAIRQVTVGDMKSLITLLKIRGAVSASPIMTSAIMAGQADARYVFGVSDIFWRRRA